MVNFQSGKQIIHLVPILPLTYVHNTTQLALMNDDVFVERVRNKSMENKKSI